MRANPRQACDAVQIVGGGLAGCEAAWQLARAGVPVVLREMRPLKRSDAHRTDALAELVCSNSFRSDEATTNAVGLMHHEMRRMGSLIMACADRHQVPAGGALAVDRDGFAAAVTHAIEAEPLIQVVHEEVADISPTDSQIWIIATGPLTSTSLAEAIARLVGAESLSFFDAIAPIVHRESIEMEKAWFQSRYDKVGPGGDGRDYINCPLDRDQYQAFVEALIGGEKTSFKDWEHVPYFDGCLPVEVMAERGPETLRHGPLKPMGLTNVHNPAVKAYAVVQLRQDNTLATLYNMVGFQTKLKHAEQVRIFRMIPGLERAEFARLGGLHRNTYLDSPRALDPLLRLKSDPRVRFAGQITGCEGYVESAATGLMAGRIAAAERLGVAFAPPPATTAIGALINHISGGHLTTIDAGPKSFQPMNINYGLFPPIEAALKGQDGKRLRGPEKALARKRALSARAMADLETWLEGDASALAAQ